MRKIASVILLFILIFPVISFSAVIYSDNFDSYANGERPSGWWVANANTGYVSNSVSVSSPNSLETTPAGVTTSLTAGTQLTEGTYSFAVYLQAADAAKLQFLMSGNLGEYVINLDISNSYIRDNGPDAETRTDVALALNHWHNISITFSFPADLYVLTINGTEIWSKQLDGYSAVSNSFVFANNTAGTKYYDDILLTDIGPEIEVAGPLWLCGFDENYYLGDWLSYKSNYEALGWYTSTATQTGYQAIVDEMTYIRPALENIIPQSRPHCFMFRNDVDADRYIQRYDWPTPSGSMQQGYVQWDFFIAADERETSEFTIMGSSSGQPLIQLGFYSYTGTGQIRDWVENVFVPNYTFDLGQWHTALISFDCEKRHFSLFIDGDTVCDRKSMGGISSDEAGRHFWKVYSNSEWFLDDIEEGIVPASDEPEPIILTPIEITDTGIQVAVYPVEEAGMLTCVQWSDDLNGDWHTAKRYNSSFAIPEIWTDITADTAKQRFYRVVAVAPVAHPDFSGNYVYSAKFVDQSATTNPAGDIGEHYVRLGMLAFNADGSVTNNYWEWSLFEKPDFDPTWSPFPHLPTTIGTGIGGPTYNDDEDKHIGIIPRHYGGVENLEQKTGTWNITGRRILVNYADGSWEKWYITWEEAGNLYKIEQYDASYIKAGTGYFLTYEAIETADEEKRDSLVPNVGWGFGSSTYDFTYAVPMGPAVQKNLIGCTVEYNTALDPHERPVHTSTECGLEDHHFTSNNVLRYVHDVGSYWTYGYFTCIPGPGILARRTINHIAGDSDNDGHIEDMWGHRNPGLQIIDNTGAFRGVVVIQYYPDSPPYLPLSVATRFWLDTKGTAESLTSRLEIYPEE